MEYGPWNADRLGSLSGQLALFFAYPGTDSKFELGVCRMKTDIEIAQSTKLLPIKDVASRAGIDDELLEYYGKYKAKLDLASLKDSPSEGQADSRHSYQPYPCR